MTIIAPSVLSMDYSDTKSQLNIVNKSKATWLHFDVMDGHFVPNLTFGSDIMKGLKKDTDLYFDVHLMISDPQKFCDMFIDNGANGITFHAEVFDNDKDVISLASHIQEKGCKAGICIKPNTLVESIATLLPYFDLVLVMSVEPGFGGQSFNESALEKIKQLVAMRTSHNYHYLIEVDGGINEKTGKACKEAGVDVLVAGSYIFGGDINERVDSLC